MRSCVSLVIFVSFLARVAATGTPSSAESSYEAFASGAPWKYAVQKNNHDDRPTNIYRKTDDSEYAARNIPREFDARRHFVKCANVIGEVKDQGNCASSWAVAVASAFTDRLCIATDGNFTGNLSAQNLMACGDDGQLGCGGGSAFRAWEFTMTSGIVTGGNFGSKEGCQPYRRAPCDHYGDTRMRNCSTLGPTKPTICQRKCLNKSYKVEYQNDLYKTSAVYMTSWTNVTQIQQEIMTYGPVTALMYVYDNFASYKGGVYKDTVGDLAGHQYVKLIGWGVDDDDEYWLAMNSWNSGWGDGGLFKILRGYNFCAIELLVMAGTVDVSPWRQS